VEAIATAGRAGGYAVRQQTGTSWIAYSNACVWPQAAKQEAQGRPSTEEYKTAIAAAAQQLQSWKLEAQDLRKRANMVMQAACSYDLRVLGRDVDVFSAGDKTSRTLFRVVLVDEASQATGIHHGAAYARGQSASSSRGDPLQLQRSSTLQPLKFRTRSVRMLHHLTATTPVPLSVLRGSSHGRRVIQWLWFEEH
jgi:hypothetical protein